MSNIVSTDPIADMLTRIRNAINVGKSEVTMPHSNVKESIAKLLKSSGFVEDVKTSSAAIGKTLSIVINDKNQPARITEISRMSKPGRRFYAGSADIPTVMRGRGVVIISTSKGMMTGVQAKKQGLGGELICKVY